MSEDHAGPTGRFQTSDGGYAVQFVAMVEPRTTPSRFGPRISLQSPPGDALAAVTFVCASPPGDRDLESARNCSSRVGVQRQCFFDLSLESAPSNRTSRSQLQPRARIRAKPIR